MNANDQFPIENSMDRIDRMDRVLSAFFKSELPDPFPMMKAPAARAELPMPVTMRDDRYSAAVSKSRLSLAVSVALILGGCWYLSGHISTPTERPNVGAGGSAKIPKELLKANEDFKKPTMP